MLIILFICVFIVSSCTINTYEKGFEYDNSPQVLAIAVRSDEFIHNINNLNLEFYFGRYNEIQEYSDEDYEIVSFALYFSNTSFFTNNQIGSSNGITNYTDIAEAYFIKEINFETFTTNDYLVSMNLSGKKFNHHETILVPASVLLEYEGFSITIIDIVLDKNTNQYYFGQNGLQFTIYYKHLDNDSIELE